MNNLLYYLIGWNGGKGFQIILSDGDYNRYRADDRYEYEGKVLGTLGGFIPGKNETGIIEPRMYDKPEYNLLFDPTRDKSYTKDEITKIAIRFIFEKFVS